MLSKSVQHLIICILLWASCRPVVQAKEDFDQWRLRVNEIAGYYFNGSKRCEDIPDLCQNPQTNILNGQTFTTLLPLNNHLQGQVSERSFFEKAATEQFTFLSCDVTQLSSMTKMDERAIGFQQDVIDEIASKLPTLRQLQSIIEPARQRMNQLAHSAPTGDSMRDAAYDTMTRRMIDQIAASTEKETQLFNAILASMWRADDPLMHDFVMRAVISKKSPDEFKREALQAEANDGFVSRMLGYEEFSFKEQVLDPMLKKASSDLNHLKRSSMNGHGGGYQPSFMTMDLRQMLVERSNYAQVLNDRAGQGERNASVLMCQLDRRYISGAQAVDTVIGATSMVVMGGGTVAGMWGLARMVRGAAPAAYEGLISASNVVAVAGLAMATPVIAQKIKAECFPSTPQYLLSSGARVCDEKNVQNFDEIQREKIHQENCALAGMVIAASAVPYSNLVVKYLGPAMRDKLAASRALIATKNATKISEGRRAEAQLAAASRSWVRARPQVVEDGGEEIVITARRHGKKRNKSDGASTRTVAAVNEVLEIDLPTVTLTASSKTHLQPHLGVGRDQEIILQRLATDRDPNLLTTRLAPFRKTETTIFPGQSKVSEIIESLRSGAKVRIATSTSPEHEVFDVDHLGTIYRVVICRQPSCSYPDSTPLTHNQIRTVFPLCGPEVRALVSITGAQKILDKNRAIGSNDFYEKKRCRPNQLIP